MPVGNVCIKMCIIITMVVFAYLEVGWSLVFSISNHSVSRFCFVGCLCISFIVGVTVLNQISGFHYLSGIFFSFLPELAVVFLNFS